MIDTDTGHREARELMANVGQLIDVSLAYMSLEEMLSELLDRIRHGLKADTAAILLLDSEGEALRARAARGIEEEVRQGIRIPVGRGFAGRIAAEGRPMAIEDVDHAEIMNPLLRRRGIRSLLGVPLLVEGRAIGVMHVGTLQHRKFEEPDVRLLELAAERAASAIGNAELSEQRALTEVLQRTLLPADVPAVPGMRLTAKYLPGAAGLKLGGDWYDAFAMPDGRLAFVIGDVVGHGIAAAAVMAEIRSALRAYAVEGHKPAEVILRLDELIFSLGARSATVTMLALDIEGERLWGVSAGHLPALLLEPDGMHRFVVHASAPPLGFGLGSHLCEEEVPFPAGSALLLYTDGLVERRETPLGHGLDQLVMAATSPSLDDDLRLTLADRVYERMVGGAALEDDLALLAIESLPIGPDFHAVLEASPRVLSSFRRALRRWLAHNGLSAQDQTDVVLAATEAAANAIEHAHGPVRSSFEVDCRWTADELRIEVSDSGAWRSLGTRERGRGLMIMREVMDEVGIAETDLGTNVTLVKRLGVSR